MDEKFPSKETKFSLNSDSEDTPLPGEFSSVTDSVSTLHTHPIDFTRLSTENNQCSKCFSRRGMNMTLPWYPPTAKKSGEKVDDSPKYLKKRNFCSSQLARQSESRKFSPMQRSSRKSLTKNNINESSGPSSSLSTACERRASNCGHKNIHPFSDTSKSLKSTPSVNIILKTLCPYNHRKINSKTVHQFMPDKTQGMGLGTENNNFSFPQFSPDYQSHAPQCHCAKLFHPPTSHSIKLEDYSTVNVCKARSDVKSSVPVPDHVILKLKKSSVPPNLSRTDTKTPLKWSQPDPKAELIRIVQESIAKSRKMCLTSNYLVSKVDTNNAIQLIARDLANLIATSSQTGSELEIKSKETLECGSDGAKVQLSSTNLEYIQFQQRQDVCLQLDSDQNRDINLHSDETDTDVNSPIQLHDDIPLITAEDNLNTFTSNTDAYSLPGFSSLDKTHGLEQKEMDTYIPSNCSSNGIQIKDPMVNILNKVELDNEKISKLPENNTYYTLHFEKLQKTDAVQVFGNTLNKNVSMKGEHEDVQKISENNRSDITISALTFVGANKIPTFQFKKVEMLDALRRGESYKLDTPLTETCDTMNSLAAISYSIVDTLNILGAAAHGKTESDFSLASQLKNHFMARYTPNSDIQNVNADVTEIQSPPKMASLEETPSVSCKLINSKLEGLGGLENDKTDKCNVWICGKDGMEISRTEKQKDIGNTKIKEFDSSQSQNKALSAGGENIEVIDDKTQEYKIHYSLNPSQCTLENLNKFENVKTARNLPESKLKTETNDAQNQNVINLQNTLQSKKIINVLGCNMEVEIEPQESKEWNILQEPQYPQLDSKHVGEYSGTYCRNIECSTAHQVCTSKYSKMETLKLQEEEITFFENESRNIPENVEIIEKSQETDLFGTPDCDKTSELFRLESRKEDKVGITCTPKRSGIHRLLSMLGLAGTESRTESFTNSDSSRMDGSNHLDLNKIQ